MTASTATAPADEVTPYARKALIASTAGYAMDGFDFLILGFMLTAIRADLGLSQSEAASLATWTLLGAVAGGIGFGILSDHLGRVRVLTWTILLFAVFTGLSALARGYWNLPSTAPSPASGSAASSASAWRSPPKPGRRQSGRACRPMSGSAGRRACSRRRSSRRSC